MKLGCTEFPPFDAAPAVAVLGAGITGLSGAWHLRRQGIPVTVFEASGRAGGAIQSVREGGWLHETGPNSILDGSPEIGKLFDAVGLGERRLTASAAAKHRYVVRGGKLVPVPASPGALLFSRLFSARAKLRLATEIFRPPGAPGGVETVAEFTLRRLGREFLDYAVDPLVGGVYAGDPAWLSVRHAFPKLLALEQRHGSLLRGALRQRSSGGGPAGRLCSFPEGLEELPRALAETLAGSLRLRTQVRSVLRQSGSWQVVSECNGEIRQEIFSAVVCALPAGALAQVRFEGFDHSGGLALLGEMEHPPVASVFTGFRREDVAHPLNGFGLLAPKIELRSILGALFSSSLFPGRAPPGHVALTSFVGGARQPALGQLGDRALTELVQAELGSLLGIRAAPAFVSVRRHPRAIPQYVLGHDRFEQACVRAEFSAPGLFIGGNCRDGVSLPACLASGKRLASAAAGFRASLLQPQFA